MNISDMNDRQKSVTLAALRGWQVSEHEHEHVYIKRDEQQFAITLTHPFYLYDKELMWLAWDVLNWAGSQVPQEVTAPGGSLTISSWTGRLRHFWKESQWAERGKLFLYSMPPAEAQRLWLDKILSLAIEAGMVKDEQ